MKWWKRLKPIVPPKLRIPVEVGRWWRRNRVWKRITGRYEPEMSSEAILLETTEDKPMKGAVQEIIGAIVRHGLTLGGGAGLLSDNEAEQAAAAIMTLFGLAWSVVRKLRNKPRAT